MGGGDDEGRQREAGKKHRLGNGHHNGTACFFLFNPLSPFTAISHCHLKYMDLTDRTTSLTMTTIIMRRGPSDMFRETTQLELTLESTSPWKGPSSR